MNPWARSIFSCLESKITEKLANLHSLNDRILIKTFYSFVKISFISNTTYSSHFFFFFHTSWLGFWQIQKMHVVMVFGVHQILKKMKKIKQFLPLANCHTAMFPIGPLTLLWLFYNKKGEVDIKVGILYKYNLKDTKPPACQAINIYFIEILELRLVSNESSILKHINRGNYVINYWNWSLRSSHLLIALSKGNFVR